VYVLGDFNARHKKWELDHADQKERCSRGHHVHTQLLVPHTARTRVRGRRRDVPLTLINTMFTTSRHVPTREQTGSVIDLALTTHPHTVGAMHVMSDSMLGSDHWPVMISIPRISPVMRDAIPRPVRVVSPPDFERKYDDDGDASPLHNDEEEEEQPLLVKPSTIPGIGYGLFANTRYRTGDIITEYKGEILTEAQKQARYPSNNGHYVMKVKENMYIDAVDASKSSVARYINSSGGGYNNSSISPYHTREGSKMNIVATRDITPGTEIFMPYGSSFHMLRARPPTATPTIPTTQWEHGMTAPDKKQTDGRTRWRINPDVDWHMFQQHTQTPLIAWMNEYQHITPRIPIPPPRLSRLHGSLYACAYTDGASRGNPGRASCGGVIYLARDKLAPSLPPTADPIYKFGVSLGFVTNNHAEYQGVIEALQAALQMSITHIKVYVDSQLVCRQIQGMYQVRDSKLMPLHARCMALVSQMEECTLHHVMREDNKDNQPHTHRHRLTRAGSTCTTSSHIQHRHASARSMYSHTPSTGGHSLPTSAHYTRHTHNHAMPCAKPSAAHT
jgi:ribonuclease HI